LKNTNAVILRIIAFWKIHKPVWHILYTPNYKTAYLEIVRCLLLVSHKQRLPTQFVVIPQKVWICVHLNVLCLQPDYNFWQNYTIWLSFMQQQHEVKGTQLRLVPIIDCGVWTPIVFDTQRNPYYPN
jgi:hypothetical protein